MLYPSLPNIDSVPIGRLSRDWNPNMEQLEGNEKASEVSLSAAQLGGVFVTTGGALPTKLFQTNRTRAILNEPRQ